MTDKRKIVRRKDIDANSTEIWKQHIPKEKRKMRERKTVNDLSTSVSSWTFPMMCKYIDFLKDVSCWNPQPRRRRNIKTNLFLKEEYKNMFQQYKRKIHLNPHANASHGISVCTESDVKSALSILVDKLAITLKLEQMEEATIDLSCYPSCRLDFLLTYKNIPVGCIEAKTKGTFKKKAFAQAVIQLVVLQQWAYKLGIHYHKDMIKVPIFNILSDGNRFVLLRLRRNKIYVEKTWTEDEIRRRIIIRDISDEESLFNIFETMLRLCSDAVSKVDKVFGRPAPNSLIHSSDSPGHCAQEKEKSLDKVENEKQWNRFLAPLVPMGMKRAKKQKRKKPKQDIPIVKDTIEGPKSLSRKFGTMLGETFYPLSNEDISKTKHLNTQSNSKYLKPSERQRSKSVSVPDNQASKLQAAVQHAGSQERGEKTATQSPKLLNRKNRKSDECERTHSHIQTKSDSNCTRVPRDKEGTGPNVRKRTHVDGEGEERLQNNINVENKKRKVDSFSKVSK